MRLRSNSERSRKKEERKEISTCSRMLLIENKHWKDLNKKKSNKEDRKLLTCRSITFRRQKIRSRRSN